MTIKRSPEIAPADRKRYARLSKADLMDAYIDLYQQVFGERTPDTKIWDDIESRTRALKRYRDAGRMRTPVVVDFDQLKPHQERIVRDALNNGCVFLCAYDEGRLFGRYDYSYTQLEWLIDGGWLVAHGYGDVIRQRYVASEKSMRYINELDNQ